MQDWLFFGFWISDVLPGGQTLVFFKGFGLGYWIRFLDIGVLVSINQQYKHTLQPLNLQ